VLVPLRFGQRRDPTRLGGPGLGFRLIASFVGPQRQSPGGDGQRCRDDGSDKNPKAELPLPIGSSDSFSFACLGFFRTLLLRPSRGFG
jgi:hypothetical protein